MKKTLEKNAEMEGDAKRVLGRSARENERKIGGD